MEKKQLPNLAPLRGFLAITVVLLHIPLMTQNFDLPYFNDLPIFNRGYHAVWVFFTLSGFLIIHLLYKEKERNGQVNIKQFYGRRILRIYPVYYFVLLFGLSYYSFVLPLFHIPYEVNYSISEALLWCVALLPNVFFSLFSPGGILSVLWSIGIEEQFYLMIAPLTRFIKNERFALILGVFTVVYFVLYFIPEFEVLRRYRFQYFYFSMGGMIAILNHQKKINFLLLPLRLRIVLYSLFFLYFFTDSFEFNNEVLKHGFSLLLFPLFILNISSENELVVNNKFFNYLGEISYGIYMYHMIALNVTIFIGTKLQLTNSLGFTGSVLFYNLATLIITVIFAHISYYYFEKRFIQQKKRNIGVIVTN